MQKKITSLLIVISLLVLCLSQVAFASTAQAAKADQDTQWKLVWNDEFNGTEIDTSKWNFVVGAGGYGNNELQFYTDRKENAYLENGSLHIKALKEDYQGSPYTSAKMTTANKGDWTYGKYEIRAKLPKGKGMWPAIWMMPTDYNLYTGWPTCGEIDIMEFLGHDLNTVYGTLHYGMPWTHTGTSYKLPNNGSFADDYHLFTLEWLPGEMRWYVDGILYQTQNDWFSQNEKEAAEYTYPAPFDRDFYLQLNLACGGNWPGYPDETTVMPQSMDVDYVRVYASATPYPPAGPRPTPPPSDIQPLRPTLPDGNYIYNGTFDQDVADVEGIPGATNSDYWSLLASPEFGGAGTATNENGAIKVDITNGGNQSYSVQLIQPPLFVEKGQSYRVSFDAKSTVNRSIMTKVTQVNGSWIPYSGEKTIQLTPDMKTFTYDFAMTSATDNQARIEFNLGLNTNPVYIDNVKIVKLDKTNLDKAPLATGNYIYNGTFDQGPDRLIYWNLATKDNAVAAMSVGTTVNERELKVKIGTHEDKDNGNRYGVDHKLTGTKPESIQVYQDKLNVQKDESYIVTFNARATAPRSITVSVGNENGVSYSQPQIIPVTTAMDTYTFEFKMNQASDKQSRLEFNLGTDVHDVYVDNVTMIKKKKPVTPPPMSANILKNGAFDSSVENWGVWFSDWEGSHTDMSVTDGVLKAAIAYEGNDFWGTQVFQNNVNIEAGQTYVVSFDAKSSVARNIQAIVEQNGGSYTKYFGAQTVALTPAWNTYVFEFTMQQPTDPTAHFVFALGKIEGANVGAPHDVYFDNVIVAKKSSVSTPPPAEGQLVLNGAFDNGTESWGVWFADWEGAHTDMAVADGLLKASIAYEGNETWATQVFQNNINFVNGKSYAISFDAKASVARDMQVIIELNGGAYTKYFGPQVVHLTPELTRYNFEFTMAEPTDPAAHLVFALGKIGDANIGAPHDVYLDNVSVVEK